MAFPSSGVAGALARNWGPLFTNRLFRALWLANLASDFGYWMNSVGASWTMTDLSISPLLNTCIQASTTLPMFLLALPSGALADATDRSKLLYRVQAGSTALTARPFWRFASAMSSRASGSISSGRSRSGGNESVTAFRR